MTSLLPHLTLGTLLFPPVGAPLAGRLSDLAIRRARRKHEGVPEDRLQAAVFPLGALVPGAMLAFGFVVQFVSGKVGIALAGVTLFFHGLGANMILSPTTSYGVDVVGEHSAEITAASAYVAFRLFNELPQKLIKFALKYFFSLSPFILCSSLVTRPLRSSSSRPVHTKKKKWAARPLNLPRLASRPPADRAPGDGVHERRLCHRRVGRIRAARVHDPVRRSDAGVGERGAARVRRWLDGIMMTRDGGGFYGLWAR